nr:xylulose kinase-1 [Tanacetum cinerariifolium]
MKMEHYLSHTEYRIWQVILNGNGPVSVTIDTNGIIKVLPSKIAKEVVARERERKARTTLLMALPEDHLAKFHKMADAKEMFKFLVVNIEMINITGRKQLSTARHKVSTAGISKITPLFPSMLTQEAIAEGEDLGTPIESQPTPSPSQPSAGDQPLLTKSSSYHDSSRDPRVDLEGTCGSGADQVNLPHDSPLSGGHTSDRPEGSLNLEALSALCTNLSNMVLALETVKDAQAEEILTLMARIKKLEKRCKPGISHHRSWLRSVSFLSKKKKLSKKTSVSKQGRKNAKLGPTKDGSDKLDAKLDEDIEYIDTEEAVNKGRQGIVDTARPDFSTASKNLLKDDKAKGVAFKDSESTYRPARSILTLKPLPTIDPKDKGKGVLEEPESAKKMTKSDFDAAQIASDEEIARQLEVELQAEVERERQREEQPSMDYIENLYDEVQTRIDVDHELAVRWTHEEQKKCTVDERAKLLAEYFERRKKQLTKERAAAIRNKPLTKTQLRRLMMTYLKNMGRFTHSQLNKKSFEDIQGIYMKEHKLITDFVPIRSEEDERMIRDMNKKAKEESSNKDVDNTKKRKEGSRMKRMSKRKKTDVDLEEEEKLKTFLKIDPDEEGVIDYEVLDKRFPIINWESKFYHYDKHGAEGIYYRILDLMEAKMD